MFSALLSVLCAQAAFVHCSQRSQGAPWPAGCEPRPCVPLPAGGENAGDAFYRYKMPKLQARVSAAQQAEEGWRLHCTNGRRSTGCCRRCWPAQPTCPLGPPPALQIEGRGNGIKTNVVNNAEIAKALERPADCEPGRAAHWSLHAAAAGAAAPSSSCSPITWRCCQRFVAAGWEAGLCRAFPAIPWMARRQRAATLAVHCPTAQRPLPPHSRRTPANRALPAAPSTCVALCPACRHAQVLRL